jgi:MFS family permease
VYERVPKRPLLAVSLLLAAGASLIYSFGYGFWPLFIGRLVWGLGWSFQWIGCRTLILEVSDDSNRATLNGLYQMFFLAGVGFASFFGGLLAENLGFHTGQRISAAILVVMALVWYRFLPEGKPKSSNKRDLENKKKWHWPLLAPSLVTAFIMRFIERGVLAATVVLWVGSLLGDRTNLFGLSLSVTVMTGLVNVIQFLPSMANAPLIGFISDKLGKRWIVIAVTMLAIGAGLGLMSAEAAALALVGGLFVSLFRGSAETLLPAIIGDAVRDESAARVLGIVYIGADLGAMLGPIVSLALLDNTGMTVREMYLLCIILLVISAVIAFIASRSEKGIKKSSLQAQR